MIKKFMAKTIGALTVVSVFNGDLNSLAAGELDVASAGAQFNELSAGNYKVENAEDLRVFASLANAGQVAKEVNVYLAKDVSIENWQEPIGKDAKNAYQGVFDGRFHEIEIKTNFETGRYLGLFGVLGEAAEVQNLKISGELTSDLDYVRLGSIAGLNKGKIKNCNNESNINTTGECSAVGGTAGSNLSGEIVGCKNTGTVFGSFTGGISGVSAGKVLCCYNLGSVLSRRHAGGISGGNFGEIKDCFNVGSVSLEKMELSICDQANNEDLGCGVGTVVNCYYLKSCLGGGRGNKWGGALEESQMQSREFADQLNITREGGAFCFVEGQLPVLAWELELLGQEEQNEEPAGGVQGIGSFEPEKQDADQADKGQAELNMEADTDKKPEEHTEKTDVI